MSLALGGFLPQLRAGGSGLNVAVVVNQASRNSVALGNYYCERRGVPPENLVRIDWPGDNIAWTPAQFTNVLVAPLLAALCARGISNQVDYVVLSMDIPYRVSEAGVGANSTTAALFYGFKPDPRDPYLCPFATNSQNSYYRSERPFREAPPATAQGYSFLTMMITAPTLDLARAIIDRGVASDGTFPTNRVLLQKTSDRARNVRHFNFDDTLFECRLLGRPECLRVTNDTTTGWTDLLGMQTGLPDFSLSGTTFVPGAMADNLTSHGGCVFEASGQATAFAFLEAGATASYGTVVEPCNSLAKFPSPMDAFLQGRGFSIAECYYQAVAAPYEGLMLGEPLAAPLGEPLALAWSGPESNAAVSGTIELVLQGASPTNARPIQQVDLFVDGKFFSTLTNFGPAPGNVLSVTLGGVTLTHTVASNATLASIVAALAGTVTSYLGYPPGDVFADPHGDRLGLRFIGTGSAPGVTVSNAPGSAPALTTFLRAARPDFLESIAAPENPYDREPRNHLYVSAGVTQLDLRVPFDTASLPDGFHELTAVAYEGTGVRTQTRATLPVRVQNSLPGATLTLFGADAVTAVEASFTAEVITTFPDVSLIELFTTGGRLAAATNQPLAQFPVSGAFLGAGLHPLYALVTSATGRQFRTATRYVRLVDPEPEILASVSINSPPRIGWAGAVGRRYQVLSAELPGGPYLFREVVVASNSFYNIWRDTDVPANAVQRYYRIALAP